MVELLMKRRSIRTYKKTKIEEGKIQELVKAALLSPSAKNICPWEFIVATNEELLVKLSKAKAAGSSFLKDAPLGIIVLADSSQSDVWIEDAAIAATIIHLTAEAMGLGSCWIQIRERKNNDTITAEEYVRDLLELPANIRVEAIISVGYADEEKAPHKEEELKYNKVYMNSYK